MMKFMKSAKKEIGSLTEKGKQAVKKWRLPALRLRMRVILYVSSVGLAAAAVWQAISSPLLEAVGYLVYTLAFILLCAGGFYVQRDIRKARREVFLPLIESNPLTQKAHSDYGYRTILTAGFGTGVNLAFTLCNAVWGIWNRSAWFITIAVYYSLLGGMRFFSIQSKRMADLEQDREKALRREIAVMKRDGSCLLLMTLALGGMVFLKLTGNIVTPYSAEFAIATAAYTFYKMIFAVRNRIKVRRLGSPILTAVRNIGFADALVSLFSLQVLMLVSFETGESGNYHAAINSITGFAVCTAVIVMGIRMRRASVYWN